MAFNGNQFALLGGHADEVANRISRYTAEKQKELERQQGNGVINGVDTRHMQNNGVGAKQSNGDSASKKHLEEEGGRNDEGWEVIRRRGRCSSSSSSSLVRMHFGEIPSNILIHSNDSTGIRERNNGWRREKGNRSYPAFEDQQQRLRWRKNANQTDRVKTAFNDQQQRRERENGNRSDKVKATSKPASEKSSERENRMRRRSNSGGNDNGKPDVPVSKGNDGVAHNKKQEMTLGVYEKLLEEKRKVLESLKSQESRVVRVDKGFESMHMIDKNKEESIFIKLNSCETHKLKKDTLHKKAGISDQFESRWNK